MDSGHSQPEPGSWIHLLVVLCLGGSCFTFLALLSFPYLQTSDNNTHLVRIKDKKMQEAQCNGMHVPWHKTYLSLSPDFAIRDGHQSCQASMT